MLSGWRHAVVDGDHAVVEGDPAAVYPPRGSGSSNVGTYEFINLFTEFADIN